MSADLRPSARGSSTGRSGAGGSGTLDGVLEVARLLRPPLRAVRFWVIQGGVLLVAALDVVVLDALGLQPPFGIPSSTISALLLVPVIYAALNFGVAGAVGTALWASLLMVPDWLFISGVTRATAWVEIGNLVVVNAVGVIVGQRVEREGQARRRAEQALRASGVAEARYRALFDEQHAPVLVTDAAGLVTEANAAAAGLWGPGVHGRLLSDLVDAPVTAILVGTVPRLLVGDRVFAPNARTLAVGSGQGLVQIVFVDVTEEEHRAREQRAYASHLVTVQEDERRRLAQDLHDDPLQTLTYLVRMLEHLTEDSRLPADLAPVVRRNGALATVVVDSLRTVIHGLRPPVLDDFGAVAALRQLVDEVHARCGISIKMRVGGNQVRLSPECELTVYRVAQEALNNVVRHAQATHVGVDLHFGELVVLTVTDDGCGIPAYSAMPASSAGRLGLIGMRERTTLLGGVLEVRARTPRGTMVRASVPLTLPAST